MMMMRYRSIFVFLITFLPTSCPQISLFDYSTNQLLGTIKAPSGSLLVADPFYLAEDDAMGVTITGVAKGDHPIIGLVRTRFGDS